ncbi:MAG: glycosyltransferase [Solirubrobacterales bacterium]|nr:glycosyltransferase [Solirubrobacterales bacterium]
MGRGGLGDPRLRPRPRSAQRRDRAPRRRRRARAARPWRARAARRRAQLAPHRRGPRGPARAGELSVRVGVVTKWFNRGQPVVGRQLRSALDQLGHETFVLARPKKERGPRPGALDRDDVWDQPGITEASAYDVPATEYARWVTENGIEAIFCDQNYQFAELAALRRSGVRTIGRFVWEHFAAEHVDGAREAFDLVYSLTGAEQERYRGLGLETPYVPWGCHPELLAVARKVRGADPPSPSQVTFVFPGGFLGHRKPLEPVLEAFSRVRDERLRLVVKAQVERKQVRPAEEAARRDPRIEVRVADQPTAEHLREFAACDVCLAPARWEGLGLPLYEAIAFGMPAITNDAPPMNEAVHDGVNGLLVESRANGTARSGIPALDPDLAGLASAIERLADDEVRATLAAGSVRVRDTERRWDATVRGFGELLERVA